MSMTDENCALLCISGTYLLSRSSLILCLAAICARIRRRVS